MDITCEFWTTTLSSFIENWQEGKEGNSSGVCSINPLSYPWPTEGGLVRRVSGKRQRAMPVTYGPPPLMFSGLRRFTAGVTRGGGLIDDTP